MLVFREYSCNLIFGRQYPVQAELVVMQPLLFPKRVLDGVIVIFKHLTHSERSKVLRGELFLAMFLHLDFISYPIACLKVLALP